MAKHFGRLVLCIVLAVIAHALGGCVLGSLDAGFTLTPPGGFFKLQGFQDDKPTTQPVKIIGVDIAPADMLPAKAPI